MANKPRIIFNVELAKKLRAEGWSWTEVSEYLGVRKEALRSRLNPRPEYMRRYNRARKYPIEGDIDFYGNGVVKDRTTTNERL